MGRQNKFTVLAVDDHPVYLDGLVPLLRMMKNVHHVFTALNGLTAIELFRQHQPDLVLMDLNMKGMDGFECMNRIRAEHPDAKFIVISMHDDFKIISRAISTGISAYLVKNAGKEEIEFCLGLVMEGRPYFSPDVAKILSQAITDGGLKKPYENEKPKLTKRESEVFPFLISGYTYKQCADKLFISQHTVKTHAERIHEKLKTHAPYWLTMYAVENNIPPITEPERED
jgi:DNA-binding NarL/FixJ family response regulator